MPALKERAKTLVELIENAHFIFAVTPLELDEKATKALQPEAQARLQRLAAALNGVAWTAAEIEAAVRAFADAEGAKLADVAQPLRAALTGRMVSPPVFDVMAVLGADESLSRIRQRAAA
jgi:glutamyl-tRNA synthetase